MKSDMIEYGVDENKIYVSGIPVSDKFSQEFDKEKIAKEFDLNPNEQIVLFFVGRRIRTWKQNYNNGIKSFNQTFFKTSSCSYCWKKSKNERKA